MKAKTFYSLRKLIKEADNIAKECAVVSFDLFDTVLIRRVHVPDMIKVPVARFIAAKAVEFGNQCSWEKVLKLRDKVEKEHRARTGEHFDDHEARYPDFMLEVLTQIFKEKMSNDLLEKVTDYELTMEKAMIVPRADLVAWIKKLYKQGKKILILSDIYLPSDHLKRLIRHAGFLEYVTDVVSSADTFLAKASGNAFPMIREKYSLDFQQWLHIGDNPISDGLRPSEFGIRSLVLNDISEKKRKLIFRMYTVFSYSRPFWKGRMFQQMMLPLEGENTNRSPLYIEGYNFFAPLVGAFVQGVAERTRSLGIKRVYFMSREGWTFMKFWERAIPVVFPDGLNPEISYLYVSRNALAGATCAYQGLTQDNANIAFLSPGNRDMRDLCRVFRLDINPLKPFMVRYGLREDDSLSSLYYTSRNKFEEFHTKFLDLLENQDFQTEIKKQTIPTNNALQRYLEHEGFFDQRDVALVDVGWLGTIQRFLYEAVKHREDKPRFHGFLMGASRGIPYPTLPDNYVEGLIFDCDRFDFAGSLIMYARDIFEEAFRAHHSSLDGYDLKENSFELIFRNQDDDYGKAELLQNEYYYELQKGILDAAARFGAASAMLGFKFWVLRPWLNYLLFNKIAFPKAREVQIIRHKYHLDDFRGKYIPPKKFLKSQKHLWDYSVQALRWRPCLRMKYYVLHALSMLRR